MKKRILYFMSVLLVMLCIGCGETTIEMGEEVRDPFEEGNLYYTVYDTKEYTSLEEASIPVEKMIMPYNTYGIKQMWGEYTQISDYVGEDKMVKTPHHLMVLDIHIRNQDAIGMLRKNEFMINNICLYGEKTKTVYYPAYFTKAGEVDKEQVFHYELEQGQEEEIQLGYFVLEEDLEKVVGKINETKFKIYQ